MNKKGFSLIELLLVIAILAFVGILAIPNVIKIIDNINRKAFLNAAKETYNAAIIEQDDSLEISLFNTGNLSLSNTESSNLEYSILLNDEGNIMCYEIRNDKYMYLFHYENNGLIKNLASLEKSIESNVEENDNEVILDCSGAENFNTREPGTLKKEWYANSSIEKEIIKKIYFVNKFNYTNYNSKFNVDDEDVGGIVAYVVGNNIYVVNNRNKRSRNAITVNDASGMFQGFTNLEEIDSIGLLNFNAVTNMDNFFKDSNNISTINGFDDIDVTNVTSASHAFDGLNLNKLNIIFNKLNFSSLENASGMFANTIVDTLKISSWELSNVTDFSYMFYKSTVKTIDLDKINITKGTNFENMFSECTNLSSIVTNKDFVVKEENIVMFNGDTNLQANGEKYSSLPNANLSIYANSEDGYFSSEKHNGFLDATLYSNDGSYTVLSEEKSSINSETTWDYTEGSRKLKIDLTDLTPGSTKTLTISVPTGMYIVKDSWTYNNDEIESVEFEKLSDQGTGSYTNDYTGTLTFKIKDKNDSGDIKKTSISCNIMFDLTVWDKNAETKLTNSDPIVVNFNDESIKRISKIISSYGVGKSSDKKGYNLYTTKNSEYVYKSESGSENIDVTTSLFGNISLLSKDQSSQSYFFNKVNLEVTACNVNTSKCDNSIIYIDDKQTNEYAQNNVYAKNGGGVFPTKISIILNNNSNFNDGDIIKISLKSSLTTFNGETVDEEKSFTFTVKLKDSTADINDLKVGIGSMYTPYEDYYGSSGYIDRLGYFSVYNQGNNSFNDVKLTYKFNLDSNSNDNSNTVMKVYAVNIIAQKGQTIDMNIKLMDDDGNLVECNNISKTSNSSNYQGLYINAKEVAQTCKLDTTSKNYYFKEIKYNNGITIDGTNGGKNNYLYCYQCNASLTSGGLYMGTVSDISYAKIEITYGSNTNTYIAKSTPVKTSSLTYDGYIPEVYISNGSVSGSGYNDIKNKDYELTAGDSFELDVKIASINYPYSIVQSFKKPVLYVVFPKGVSIKNAIITDSLTSNESLSTVTYKENLKDDTVIYKISFNSNVWFGYIKPSNTSYNDSSNKAYRFIKLLLETDNSMNLAGTKTIKLNNSLYLKDENGHVSIGGSYSYYSIDDSLYDVDGDGQTNDKYGTLSNTNNVTITIK